MRLRLMATYRGVPYQAGLGPGGGEATLFSPGPPPEELGFTAAAGHWRKPVSVADLDALWQSRPVGDYRGEPCLVLDDLGDRLHIAYLGRDAARAAQLGYWEIDREVYEVVVARGDVIGLTEERVDFPFTAAMFGSEAANGNPAPPEKATLQAYHGTAVNGGPTENGQPAGYSDTDHASRMPDRMTAWHGSPEPWPGPRTPLDGLSANTGPLRPRRGPRPGPWTEEPPGTEPWTEEPPGTEPWTEEPPGTEPWTEEPPGTEPWTEEPPGTEPAPAPGRHGGRKDRIAPESVFAELLSLAAIPQGAYAVDKEVPGAMCLVETDGGFEVFSRTEDARLEVHFFQDEEAAYFYLFGVLAAEAIRSGRLAPAAVNGHRNGSARGRTQPAAENVSKYLRGRN
jgi:hypothetical protein